jgi:hypothetical protein
MAIEIGAAVQQVLDLLKETFEGSPPSGSAYTDPGPGGGIFGTLSPIDSKAASEPRCGSSIAAQVGHIVFAIDAASAWIRGDHSSRKWKESWRISTVSDAEWNDLRQQVEAGYRDLRAAIESHAATSDDAFGSAVAIVAHMAYHLGAIRQKTKVR